MRFVAICACAAAASAGACTPTTPGRKPQVDTAAIVDAIKTDEAHWNQDWAERDAAKAGAHFAADAVVMAPGAPAAIGAAAAAAGIRQALSDPGFSLSFTSDKVDVAASGDLAAARGSFKQTNTDPETKTVVTTTGSYVTVYRPRADGVWLAVWDIATPGPPASVGAAMAGSNTARAAQ